MKKLKTFAPAQAIENQKTLEEALKEFEDSLEEMAKQPLSAFGKKSFEEQKRELEEDQKISLMRAKQFVADPKSYDITFNI